MAKKKQLEITQVIEQNMDTENKAPDKVYTSFDAFFHEFALKNGVNLKWKDSLKKHLIAINCFKDQSKWLDGVKNFGL